MPTVQTKEGTKNFPYTKEGIEAAAVAKQSPDMYAEGGYVEGGQKRAEGIADFVKAKNTGLPTADARQRSYQYGGFVDTDATRHATSWRPGGEEEAKKYDIADAEAKDQELTDRVNAAYTGKEKTTVGKLLKGVVNVLGLHRRSKGLFGSEGPMSGDVSKRFRNKFMGGKSIGKRLGTMGKKLEKGLKKIFSDVHLKENIDFAGKSKDGINIYEWNYQNSPNERYRGVLAHELKKDYPDAVHKETKGLAVDYDKIDVDFEKVKNS